MYAEPKQFKEAMRDEVWRAATHFEIDAHESNRTWDLQEFPLNKKALGSK